MRNTTFPLDDVGDLTKPKGSREWAVAVRSRIQILVRETSVDKKTLRRWLDKLKQHRGWEALEDSSGRKFASFTEFSIAAIPYGLGRPVEEIQALLAEAKTPTAVDARDRKSQRPPGRPEKEPVSETLSNIQDLPKAPAGTTQAAALRRLRKDRPDLHQKVLTGKLSANAAAIEAGFRHKMASVCVDDVHAALKTLLKYFTREQIEKALTDFR